MMIDARLEHGKACDYISLNEAEAELYHGAGWAIAHVEADQITKLVYLNQFEYGSEEREAKAAIDDAMKQGNAYFGMASSYTFCDGRKMTMDDPTLFAKIMRLAVEEDV
tara:strand:- start:423 stop:749 length:327 start_codon:yes stop_codon:yes gene_type:complete